MREIFPYMAPDPANSEDCSPAAWIFPGLGCRYVGMGYDLFERGGDGSRLISLAEDFLGYRLKPVCLEGSGRKTIPAIQEAQVIYVISCAYAASLAEQGCQPRATLGHSLGSLAAAWAAGAFDFIAGLEFLTNLERLMAELLDDRGLTMGVIIGLDEKAVQNEVAEYPGVSIANYNSPLQYVIAGPQTSVDRVVQSAASRGAKQARRLPTTRAMHTPWLNEVATRLKPSLDRLSFFEPHVPFIAYDSAEPLRTGFEMHQFFSRFVTCPVFWERSFLALSQIEGKQFVEVGPGNLLKTLATFINKTTAVMSASDLLAPVDLPLCHTR